MGDIDLLELNENKGIGCALNLGVKKAADLGYQWVLTMDQDSSPEKNMIAMMLSYAYHNPSIKCLSPNFASRIYSGRTSKEGAVSYAITSGNLVNVCVFEKAGPYNEDYFIDCIDFEFSLRVRAADFEIHKVPDAVMYHDVGVVTNRIRRIVSRFYTQHSPVRRYYMFRNLLLLAKEHFLFDFLFVAKLVLGQVIFFTLMIIFEQRLIENLLLIAKGMRDGLMDKRGRYCEVEE
jgi:rhamnosyltransferase